MTVEQRIAAMERQVERLRLMGGGAAVGRARGPLMEEDVRARKFIVGDKKGIVLAYQRFSRQRDLRTLTTYDDNRTDLAGEVADLVAGAV